MTTDKTAIAMNKVLDEVGDYDFSAVVMWLADYLYTNEASPDTHDNGVTEYCVMLWRVYEEQKMDHIILWKDFINAWVRKVDRK